MFLNKSISSNKLSDITFYISSILAGCLIALVIMTVARFTIVASFALKPLGELPFRELLDFLFTSFRFDLKVATFAYVLPLVLGFIFCFTRFFGIYKKLFYVYSYIMLFGIIIFSVINYFYFKTYDKSIDTFIFAITKEDPKAVLKTIIEDYPFYTGSVCFLIGAVVLFFIHKKLITRFVNIAILPKTLGKISILLTVFIALFAFFMRGSLGTFPIRQLDAQVCDKPAINYSIPNGPIAFFWAYKWDRESRMIPKTYPETVALCENALGFNTDIKKPISILDPLYNKTPHNEFLAENKPDIVFNVMESMSTHMLTYDDENTRDLLGEFRKHAKEDFFFTNFVSEGDGTSDSLTRLLVSVPDLNLSTSRHADKDYLMNIVKIFKKAGYETVFVTASTASWRNYNNFLRFLGFDRIIERSYVKFKHPSATESAWGIDDEYLFKETLNVLKEKREKPLFVMTLSITNHPPYRYPENKVMPDLNITDDILERFPYKDTKTIFGTFQYANNELGKFISAVKNDESLANRTIIAATGDHNLRGIGYLDHPDEAMFGHAVPFYLYIPEKYKGQSTIKYDKNRLGSHKDIITTILYHTQSDLEFYSFGCDLLSDRKCAFPYAYNNFVSAKFKNNYACEMGFDMKMNSHRFSNKGILLVDKNKSNQDCNYHILHSMLEANLYFLQTQLNQGQSLIDFLKEYKSQLK